MSNLLDAAFRYKLGDRVRIRRPSDGQFVVVRVAGRQAREFEGVKPNLDYLLAGEGGAVLMEAARVEAEADVPTAVE